MSDCEDAKDIVHESVSCLFQTEEERKKGHYQSLDVLPSDPRDMSYKVIDDNITFFNAMNLNHGASDAIFCPNVKPNEGAVELLIARRPSWIVLIFLKMETGDHIFWVVVAYFEHVTMMELYKVKSFKIEPLSKHSKMDVSGEIIPTQCMFVTVHDGWCKMVF